MTKHFITAKLLKHLNLPICKYWHILCCCKQTAVHMNHMKTCKSPNSSNWAFVQKPA